VCVCIYKIIFVKNAARPGTNKTFPVKKSALAVYSLYTQSSWRLIRPKPRVTLHYSKRISVGKSRRHRRVFGVFIIRNLRNRRVASYVGNGMMFGSGGGCRRSWVRRSQINNENRAQASNVKCNDDDFFTTNI